MNRTINPLLPQICQITDMREETPDVKTFRIQTIEEKSPFSLLPGQLAMLSLLGVGEAMFSITARDDSWLEIAIKKTGLLTDALHELNIGDKVGLRGPYGNYFPVEEAKGRNLLFIGGGIGLAPVRSFILHALANRADYGHIDIVYGARSYDDLVFKDDLFSNWPQEPDTKLHITVDKGSQNWQGNVGFVPPYLEECAFSPDGCLAVLCGPPIMIDMCLKSLAKMGFADENIVTTLEMRMQCGIGKCGRCNIGSKYVCLDGPVFTQAELRHLPKE
ncbi:MAG: FAD/NAD(P)-binding protein [Clostridiales bacterium]|jgi:NAD(P)H-flavin reductase|nr:FAD/NAD(P)-binding protein [Clostridiales bacterium]